VIRSPLLLIRLVCRALSHPPTSFGCPLKPSRHPPSVAFTLYFYLLLFYGSFPPLETFSPFLSYGLFSFFPNGNSEVARAPLCLGVDTRVLILLCRTFFFLASANPPETCYRVSPGFCFNLWSLTFFPHRPPVRHLHRPPRSYFFLPELPFLWHVNLKFLFFYTCLFPLSVSLPQTRRAGDSVVRVFRYVPSPLLPVAF